jgi:hypothetical protein
MTNQQQQQQQQQQGENLQQQNNNVTMQPNGNTGNDGQAGAAPSGAEDTLVSNYEKIISRQNELIAALQDQLDANSENLQRAIRQGAALGNPSEENHVSHQQAQQQQGQIGMMPASQQSLSEPYVPLKDMDFSIKKSDLL